MAEFLKLTYISVGTIFRSFARNQNMSLEELSQKILESPELDLEIDQESINTALKGNVIIDATLSSWILKSYADLRILITAPLEIRVQRIATRDNKPYNLALSETKVREESERNRFRILYDINIDEWNVFDCVINTSNLDIDEAFTILKSTVLGLMNKSIS